MDIIPADPVTLTRGEMMWPESGATMNLCGFRHAFERGILYPLTSNLTVELAPVAVIAFLKMVSYLDRPWERDRDLADLAHLMSYEFDRDDRRFSDTVVATGIEYNAVAAFLLARDIHDFVDNNDRRLIKIFLEKAEDENDPHQTPARLIRNGPATWRNNPTLLQANISAMRLGLNLRT